MLDKAVRIAGISLLVLSVLPAHDTKVAAASPTGSASRLTSFDQALAEARRLADTDAGKAYEGEFAKVVAPRLGEIVGECTRNLGPTVKFQVVFVFAADGRLEQVLGPKGKSVAACIGDKFQDLHLPTPPHANWPVSLNVDISPNNAPRLLVEALKFMESGLWEVDATISRAFKFRVHGLLDGRDFDLTVEPEDRNAFRLIAIKDQVWTSFDGSKTWKLEDAKGHALAQRFYAFVHNPLRSDAKLPALQVVKQETRDGDTWMQLRPKISDKTRSDLQEPDYWIAISQDLNRNGVRRYEGPVTEPGHEKEPLHCVVTYQPATNKAIQPPVTAVALPEERSSTAASPDAKFAADNLKHSQDFYSKVHLVAIAKLDFGEAGTAEFKYDRYPNGGPERIQSGNGEEFTRKDGKTWLKSNDWGDTGKPVDPQTGRRLNNWVGLIQARLNGEPASNDRSEGATVMKFIGKEDEGEREEFVFEESKEKPKSKSYPHVSFGRYKNAKDPQVLLSHFSGPMQLGAREAKVDIDFSHLIAVQMKDETNAAESPSPAAIEQPRSGGLQSAAATSEDPNNNRVAASNGTTLSLLDGKLKIDIPPDFSRDPDDPKEPKTVAKFSGPDGAWGTVLRGTHGLTPEELEGYLKKRVAEYSKGFKWLSKDSHLQWLKKQIVTIDGRKWADWSFVPVMKGRKDYSHNPVYTRNLTTSYKGQLLEINLTSNLNTNPKLKEEIDHIVDSVHLEE